MSKPKIIIFDLEILCNPVAIRDNWFRVYSPYKNNGFSPELSSVLCIGWKDLEQKNVNCINAWNFKSWKKDKNDDREVLKAFYEVAKDADCVITHNGKKFDLPFLNSRLMLHGLKPLLFDKHIDTKNISSRNLKLISNSLGSVAQFFRTQGKVDSGGQELWNSVHAGNKKALNKMEYYCKHDIKATEGIFKKLRPFIKNIPNYNLFGENPNPICPNCGENKLHKHGVRRTRTTLQQRYLCQACGSISTTAGKSPIPRSL